MSHSSCVQLEVEWETNANQTLQTEINKQIEYRNKGTDEHLKSSASALLQDYVQETKHNLYQQLDVKSSKTIETQLRKLKVITLVVLACTVRHKVRHRDLKSVPNKTHVLWRWRGVAFHAKLH